MRRKGHRLKQIIDSWSRGQGEPDACNNNNNNNKLCIAFLWYCILQVLNIATQLRGLNKKEKKFNLIYFPMEDTDSLNSRVIWQIEFLYWSKCNCLLNSYISNWPGTQQRTVRTFRAKLQLAKWLIYTSSTTYGIINGNKLNNK